MDIHFGERKFVYKRGKGSAKPKVNAAIKENAGGLKPKETPAQKKARLAKQYGAAKDKLTKKTGDLVNEVKVGNEVMRFALGIDSVKKLREKISSAPIRLIEKLEDKYPGLTLAAFTNNLKGTDKLNLKAWSSDQMYSKFTAGTKYKVDFLGNNDAENEWGISDMLSITMRKLIKYPGGNEAHKRTSIRRVGLKGQNKSKRGFYDNQGYIAIHSGDAFAFENSNPEFKAEYRRQEGDKYHEIDAESYSKYAKSEHATEDQKYLTRNLSNRGFLSKRVSISNARILELRNKIGSLEGLTAKQRIKKVVEYLTKPENNIGARHCGDWVDRVYAIAGVKRKKTIYMNLNYAFVGGDYKKGGWKPESDPSRRDCRIERKFASEAQLDKIEVGDWVWINNRNRFDKAGNHSGIFLGWIGNPKNRRARIANWKKNKQGGQKISTYNFKNTPVTAIHKPYQVDDSLPQPRRAPEDVGKFIPDASKQALIARGSMPFNVQVGYRLSPAEDRWYKQERREAHRVARLNINDRMNNLQARFNLQSAMEYSAEMVNVKPKHRKYFMCMNDAVLRVESNYNSFNFNRRKAGNTSKVALSTAAGEYQILNSVHKGFKKYLSNSKRGRYYRKQMDRIGINSEMLLKVDFDAPRPENLTPYSRCLMHNVFMFRYSRLIKGLESMDSIYDKLDTTTGRTRDTWLRISYTYWRNGPGGAKAFVRNARNGITLPQTKAEARVYFDNHLNSGDWQKRRGFNDFWSVMRTTMKFAKRFNKNVSEYKG